MRSVEVTSRLDASLKQARLIDAGIDAKLFDPDGGTMASYFRASRSSAQNSQLIVPNADVRQARQVLASHVALRPADDAAFVVPTSQRIGTAVVRGVAAVILACIVALAAIQIAGMLAS